jgi:phage terminase large subunit-like protein
MTMTAKTPVSTELPPTDGALVCAWIEANLVHGEGDHFGRPFRLHAFQRKFLYRLYERDKAGRRLHRRALLGLPKGNGKTELAAAIAVLELGGPVAPASPIIPIAAASFEQADLVFGAARTMITEGPLRPYFEVFDTEILRKDGPGRLYRVAAAAGTNDGARPTCLVADELHEWTGSRERVHLVLSNGLSKRRDGLELNISTAGADRDSLLGRLYDHGRRIASGEIVDDGFLFEWHEASDTWDLEDETQLRAALIEANPAAGLFLDVERLMARAAEIPAHEFARYHLDRWVAAVDAWITPEQWQARAVPDGPPPAGTDIVIGFDGSYSRDTTALVGCTLEGYVFVIAAWERDTRDADWTVPRVEIDAAVAQAMERWRVLELACDPPGWGSEIEAWEREWPEVVLRFDTNSPARMAPACDRFYSAVVTETLRHDGDPRLARHVANAHARDTRYGRVIVKDTKDSPHKIDLAVAAVIAHERATFRADHPVAEPEIMVALG